MNLGPNRDDDLTAFSSSQVRNFAATTAVLFAVYLASYIIVGVVVSPLQEMILPDVTRFASLLFLPHGVRVLSASLLGAKSVPAMMLGELAGNYLFWHNADPITLALSALIAGTVTWLVFEGLRLLDVNAFYRHTTDEPPSFHALLLAGLIAAAANAFLLASLVETQTGAGHVTELIAAYITGDVTGMLAMVALAHYFFLRER